jgi:hypothetical protein
MKLTTTKAFTLNAMPLTAGASIDVDEYVGRDLIKHGYAVAATTATEPPHTQAKPQTDNTKERP